MVSVTKHIKCAIDSGEVGVTVESLKWQMVTNIYQLATEEIVEF